jgi:hypothetical protein
MTCANVLLCNCKRIHKADWFSSLLFLYAFIKYIISFFDKLGVDGDEYSTAY